MSVLLAGRHAAMPRATPVLLAYSLGKTQELLACYLEQAAEKGLIRCDDPFAAAQYLTSLCTARAHQQLLTGVIDTIPPDRIREEVADAVAVFLRAFRP